MGNLLKINAQYLAYNQSIHPSTHLPTKMICHHHLQNDMYRLKIGFPMNNLDYFCPPHYTTPWQCCCCGSSSRSQRRPVHRDRRFSLFISKTKRTRAAFVCRHHHRPHVPSRPVPSRRRLTIWAVLLLLGGSRRRSSSPVTSLVIAPHTLSQAGSGASVGGGYGWHVIKNTNKI